MRVSTENDGGNAGMGKFGMEVIRQVIDFVSQIGPLKHNVKCHRNCVRNASEMRQKCVRNASELHFYRRPIIALKLL